MNSEENVGDVLARRLAHHGLLKTFIASKICDAASQESEGDFEPVSFKQGCLKVSVVNSAKGHFVKLRQKDLIERINKRLDNQQVTRLIVVVREPDSE